MQEVTHYRLTLKGRSASIRVQGENPLTPSDYPREIRYDMTPIERARALRRDYDDMTRQAQESGRYSDPPAEMVASPSLPSVDHWQILRIPNLGPVLAGWARSHPVLGPSDCWFVSTPLERIDPAGKWAWSKNHLFRLLRPADPLKEAERWAVTLNSPREATSNPVEHSEDWNEAEAYDQSGLAAF